MLVMTTPRMPASGLFFPRMNRAAPNAALQAPPIAGATQERRLSAVACKRLLDEDSVSKAEDGFVSSPKESIGCP
jgi:hypothetical protein